MNTLHFKYAVEVERTRSITQAADNLFMAQPNLSKAIKELEDTLGIVIFKRTPRGVSPTSKGAKFLVYAKNILAEIDKMESLYVPENSERQCFKISIPRGSYIASAVTKLVAELDTKKEINVSVQETNSVQAINNIVNGQYSLGIIRYQCNYENYFLDYLSEKNICQDPIWEFEYLALMSEHHALASCKEILHRDLIRYTEIVHGDTVIPYLTDAGIKADDKPAYTKKRIYVYERGSQFDMLSQVPSTYMWVSPIPARMLALYELVQRKCAFEDNRYKDLLIYPEGYVFSDLDKKFIAYLHTAKDEVASKEYR